MLKAINKQILDCGENTCGKCRFLMLRTYHEKYPLKKEWKTKKRYKKFKAKISVLRASNILRKSGEDHSLHCKMFEIDLISHDQYIYRCPKCKEMEEKC